MTDNEALRDSDLQDDSSSGYLPILLIPAVASTVLGVAATMCGGIDWLMNNFRSSQTTNGIVLVASGTLVTQYLVAWYGYRRPLPASLVGFVICFAHAIAAIAFVNGIAEAMELVPSGNKKGLHATLKLMDLRRVVVLETIAFSLMAILYCAVFLSALRRLATSDPLSTEGVDPSPSELPRTDFEYSSRRQGSAERSDRQVINLAGYCALTLFVAFIGWATFCSAYLKHYAISPIIIGQIALLAPFLLYCGRSIGWRETGERKPLWEHTLWFVAAPIAAIGTAGVALGYITLVGHYFGVSDTSAFDILREQGHSTGIIILSMGIIAPIYEELALRGVVLGQLQCIMKPTEAVVVTATMFAVMHFSPILVPFFFLCGVIAAWLRLSSGLIYPSILWHVTHNAVIIWAAHTFGEI